MGPPQIPATVTSVNQTLINSGNLPMTIQLRVPYESSLGTSNKINLKYIEGVGKYIQSPSLVVGENKDKRIITLDNETLRSL